MAARIALALVFGSAPVWIVRASVEQEVGSIPIEAGEPVACSANDGSEDCQLHLLQLRARGLASATDPTNVTVQAEQSGPENLNVSANSAGRCTEGEHRKMTALGGGNRAKSFPELVASCSKKALKWLKFSRDKATDCISKEVGISKSCAGCYSYIGEYGYKNCKKECVFSKWCGNGCLSCTSKSHPSVEQCAGVSAPKGTVC